MVENTLSVGRISEGFVLDHIEAGKSMEIYKYLNLDKLDCCVAIIKNARSGKMGKKDIMKIECPIDFMDLDILVVDMEDFILELIKRADIIDHLPDKVGWIVINAKIITVQDLEDLSPD